MDLPSGMLPRQSYIRHLEVTCNNILRKIWSLPRRCHTSILQLVANIESIFNSTILRSNRLIVAATESSSRVLADVFQESSFLAYTSCGYNCLYGSRHVKQYSTAESLCAAFVRDVRMAPPSTLLSWRKYILSALPKLYYSTELSLLFIHIYIFDHRTYCGVL